MSLSEAMRDRWSVRADPIEERLTLDEKRISHTVEE
jgi:hypothetical protein